MILLANVSRIVKIRLLTQLAVEVGRYLPAEQHRDPLPSDIECDGLRASSNVINRGT